MKNKYIGAVVLTILAASCQVTKPYQRPELTTQGLYRGESSQDTISIAGISWKQFFPDTALTHLITKGLEQNPDLRIAMQHIVAAKASLQLSKSAFLPDLNGTLSVKQSKLAFPQGFGIISSTTQYDLGLGSSWEADIWGKLRSAKRGALAGLLRTEEARKAIQTQLIADIAGNYYTLLVLDQQLAILEKTKNNRFADVKAVTMLKEANILNGAAISQSEANAYAAEIAIPALKNQIRETENALNLLLGQPSGAVTRTTLDQQKADIPLKTGVPSQLLQNRPDVKQAEYALWEAFENTNVAKTFFYPALTITANGGFTSFNFQDWLTSLGLFGNVAAGLTQPIFNRGANKARLATAKARQEQAAIELQKSMLTAGREVSDALYAYETAGEQREIRVKQLASLEKAVDANRKLLRFSSTTNYTDVLTSEQNLLAAELDAVNDRHRQWLAVIRLYHALGGGTR
ncbi:MAG: TolC family protein [Dyadobacter fermentans]